MKILSSLFALALLATGPLHAAPPALELTVKPERDWLLQGGPREAIFQVALKASDASQKRTQPLNLSLVLDRSGSMAGAKLEKARQAACVAVDQLNPEDIVSVIVYDDSVRLLVPPQKARDREAIKREINRITDGGSTALYAGVKEGAAQLRKFFDKERVNRIILLSDGIANVGPSSTEALSLLGRELRGEGLGVSTIGLGDDYNEDLMTALAESSRANYYYVKDAEKLPGIFREELNTAQSVVARNVALTITLPEGISGAAVLGDDQLSFRDGKLTIPLSDLYGSQSRRFLISCQAPSRNDAELELASVTVSYDQPDTQTSASATASARIGQTEDRAKADNSLRPEVASEVALTRNRVAKEQAIKLADQGKTREAADLLSRQITINIGLPAAAQSQTLQDENTRLNERAGELQRNGSFSNSSRKTLQYENYRGRNSLW